MFSRRAPISAACCAALGLLASGCDLPSLLAPPAEAGALYITGAEGLGAPPVKLAGLYRVDRLVPVDLPDASSGGAAAFSLDLVTVEPGRVQMRLLGSGAGPADLHRIRYSGPMEAPDGLPDDGIAALQSGQGVFWHIEAAGPGPLTSRFGVLLPAAWSGPSVRLEVYAATTQAGEPFLGDSIELARDFYYMAAVGESVMWGNGLPRDEKFCNLVANEIQRRTGRRVILRLHAISGAMIIPGPSEIPCPVSCNGEVPTASTSISTQVDLLESPGELELVLVSGCINEVDVFRILIPETDDALLTSLTHESCHDRMLGLLQKVRSTAPRAAVAVAGYYPIVSQQTRVPPLVEFFLAANQASAAQGAELISQSARQSGLFLEEAREGLSNAAREAADRAPGAPVLFIDPGFLDEHALFTSQSLLWGLTANRTHEAAASEGLTLFPEDPVAELRATACFNPNVLVNPLTCFYASVGHPNPEGARRYAEAILSALELNGVIPHAPP